MKLMDLKLYIRYVRNYLQNTLTRRVNVHYSSDVKIGSRISRDICVGRFAYIGEGSEITKNVVIGDYSMLATSVSIVGGDHVSDRPGTPIVFSGRPPAIKTIIGKDVWLGHKATILAGVTIGDGSIVAAGSVVTKSIPPLSVFGGIPAVFIKDRFNFQRDKDLHIKFLNGTTERGLPPGKKEKSK